MTMIPNGCRRAITSRMWGWNEMNRGTVKAPRERERQNKDCLVVAEYGICVMRVSKTPRSIAQVILNDLTWVLVEKV
jgi:hypothetical protein